MGTWTSHRYAITVIDDELARLAALKLDTSPADPSRRRLLAQIDAMLDQRNAETRAMRKAAGDQQV